MAEENTLLHDVDKEEPDSQYYGDSMRRSAPPHGPNTDLSAEELAYTKDPRYIQTHEDLDLWRGKCHQEAEARSEGGVEIGRDLQKFEQEVNNVGSNAAIIAEIKKTRDQINKLAKFSDTAFNLPILKHFGLDSILGMFGLDFSTLILGSYIAYKGRKQGLPKKDIVRIMAHSGADWLLGNIPFLGLIMDFVYKSNKKGAEIFESYAERRIAEVQAQDKARAGMSRRRRSRH